MVFVSLVQKTPKDIDVAEAQRESPGYEELIQKDVENIGPGITY